MRIPILAVLTCSLFAGCMGPRSPVHHATPWLDDARIQEMDQLSAQKAVTNRDGQQPVMQEIEGCGTMFVWNHALSGGLGWEDLKASYSYKNTSDARYDIVRVWIEVLDPDGQVVSRKEDVLMHPMGYALMPGDTWSDVLKVETKGVHLKEGWDWRIGCEPVRMKVLAPKRYGND